MFVQKVNRKDIIANALKSCQGQDFFTTFKSHAHWPFSTGHQQQQKCRLLILDSSFNPPTKAHANLLSKALSSKPPHYFDASLLLFTTNNVDKELKGASVLQRAYMMELMAMSFSNIAVGFTSHGKFIDKAQAIHSHFKNEVELYFILGYDTITRLFDPKYYSPVSVKDALKPFFDTCHLICADRGEQDEAANKFWDRVNKDYEKDLIQRIQLDSDAQSISSTLARSLLSSNNNADDDKLNTVLESSIVQYIREQNIYTDKK